jgi:uncharacterized protein
MNRIRAITFKGSLIPRAAFAAIWMCLFAYAGRPLLVTAAAGGVAPAIAWSALVILAALPFLPIFIGRGDALAKRSFAHWIGYATAAVFSLLFVLVALGDIVRLIVPPIISARAISLSILAAAGGLSLVGLFQARFPRIKRVTVGIENLPDELRGYRIAQWSDVHVGPTIQRGFVESLVARTNAVGADAIAITGDLVDGYLDELRDQVGPLADLRARDGVFYVTGNHEYYWRASEWVKELQRLGLQFLKNEHRVIRRGDATLVMAGVTDPVGRHTHKQDPDAALEGAPEGIRVLLSHRPQTARAASRLGVDLQLSGHTHGGQFFPFNLLIGFFQPIVSGLHRVGRTWLYVSRGTGYWGPPSRLGVGSEITVIELQ